MYALMCFHVPVNAGFLFVSVCFYKGIFRTFIALVLKKLRVSLIFKLYVLVYLDINNLKF